MNDQWISENALLAGASQAYRQTPIYASHVSLTPFDARQHATMKSCGVAAAREIISGVFARAADRHLYNHSGHHCSSSSNALASFRSRVSNPSVNQP